MRRNEVSVDESESLANDKRDPQKRSLLWLICQSTLRVLVTVLFRFRVYGLENVPRTGAVILAANHQSYLDPALLGVHLRRPIGFLANAYLFRVMVFGPAIRNLHAFPVERGKGNRAAIDTAITMLKRGYALNVFPEGTRTPNGEIQPLERGVLLLARKSGAPVVPIAIDGAYDAWPRKQKLFRPHPVHLIYGRPIDATKMDNQQFMDTLDSEIRRLHAELVRRRNELRAF